MKKNIITSFKYGTIIFALFGGLLVFAYTQPVDQSQNAFKPVTTDSQNQTMESLFSTTFFLKAGNTLTIPTLSTDNNPTWNGRGYIIAEKNIVSPKLFVDRFLYLGTNKSQVKIGGSDVNPNLPPSQPFTGDMITPLIIDMNGRATGINSREGREVMELYGSDRLTVSVNTPAIQFSSTANPAGSDTIGKADVIAKSLQLHTPPNYNGIGSRVLVATDNKGNATWGTMKIVTDTNGTKRIQVDYPGSVVAAGQNSCSAPTDMCPNITGTQTSVPSGMIVNTSGDCVAPIDLCTNIAGTQTTIPTGMSKDTAGDVPGNCSVDMCINLDGIQAAQPAGWYKDTPLGTPGNCTECMPGLVPIGNGTCSVDVCPNITGAQIVVPTGMMKDDAGQCVAIDLCTNIAGAQATVPTGMTKDTSGTTPGICTAPVDMCPNITGVQTDIPYGMIVNSIGYCRDVCVTSGSTTSAEGFKSGVGSFTGTYSTNPTEEICSFSYTTASTAHHSDLAVPAGFTCSVTGSPTNGNPASFTCTDNAGVQPAKVFSCPGSEDITYQIGYGYQDHSIHYTRNTALVHNSFMSCGYNTPSAQFTQINPR